MRRIVLAAALLLAACNKNNSANEMAVENATEENLAPENIPEPAKIDCDVIHERVTQDECDDIRALSKDVRAGAAALDVPNPMTRGQKSQVTLVVDRRPLPEIHRLERPTTNAVGSADMNAAEPATNAVATVDMNASAPANSASAANGNPVNEEAMQENAAPPEAADGGGETPNQVVQNLPGENYSFPSQVGRYMKATLSGQGFEIRLISPDDPVQEIPAGGQGTWIWEVIPDQGGVHSLTARTDAVAIVNGKAKPLGNGTTTKTVDVRVRPIDRLWDFLSALPAWFKLIAGVLGALLLVVVAWKKLGKAFRGGGK